VAKNNNSKKQKAQRTAAADTEFAADAATPSSSKQNTNKS
jgi:hypothetical protein